MGSYLDKIEELREKEINANVCKMLKDIRVSKGITQVYLSELSGVHRPLISEIETGARPRVSYEVIHRIANGLGLEIVFKNKKP